MGKPTGFLEYPRELPKKRPVEERVRDWNEFETELTEEKKREQAARCMNCGVPFCNQGCPLGNLIPDWNDLIYREQWEVALRSLHKTNNFPEFTGRICPAPCEAACVLGINDNPVTIKQVEWSIINYAWENGLIKPQPPEKRTGKKVAVIGSGPAGLAAADQLNKAGHTVIVYERASRPGGLLTFGIPDFKLDKKTVDRRLNLMRTEGVEFKCGINVGKDISMEELRRENDAVVLALGSTHPRDIPIPGRDLNGVHYAMDFLTPQNAENYGDRPDSMPLISAKDKNVVIIGGGDTGADCYGTSVRHGAKSILQIELTMRPPEDRPWYNPWPEWPLVFYTSPAHQEGGERRWSLMTKEFVGDGKGNVKALRAIELDWTDGPPVSRQFKEREGSEVEIPADLVLLAVGYVGPEKKGPIEDLGIDLDRRGNIKTNENYMSSLEGVFAAGDARRGQSLVVWAISEGRKCARGVDEFLMGTSDLPG